MYGTIAKETALLRAGKKKLLKTELVRAGNKKMTKKRTNLLVNLNRTLIFALTLMGLLMDGYQSSDMPITLAAFVWLWQSAFVRVEARILSRSRTKHTHQPTLGLTRMPGGRQ